MGAGQSNGLDLLDYQQLRRVGRLWQAASSGGPPGSLGAPLLRERLALLLPQVLRLAGHLLLRALQHLSAPLRDQAPLLLLPLLLWHWLRDA